MAKTIIIPDIHNNYTKAEAMIDREKPDQIVFLGDFFDNIGNTLEDTSNTAQWLKDSLEKPDRVHIIGNHDLSYMSDNDSIKCSGYNELKHSIIKSTKIDWRKLVFHYWLDDWLCTHAGLTRDYYIEYKQKDQSVKDFLVQQSSEAMENISDGYDHRLFNASMSRGGSSKVSGILWCDYDEFVDIPGVKQIFGHTNRRHIRYSNYHICIDTGLKHYGVYQNREMKVKWLR
jgi:hypothetical protein